MLKEKIFTFLSVLIVVSMLTMLLTGCGSKTDISTGSDTAAAVSAVNTSSIEESDMFTSRDQDPSYDDASSAHVIFDGSTVSAEGSGVQTDGSTVTITEEGTYVLSGSSEDGQVIVSADSASKIQLVLNGLTLKNSGSACILVTQADKVFITLAEGSENALSDNGQAFSATVDDSNIDGVIFSKDTLTFNGSGALAIQASANHAIVSKDDLKFTGGTYQITSSGKALSGKDSIRIKDGTFEIDSEDDALHSDNEEDGKGFVYIEGGTMNIATQDDGIHAENSIAVEGGTINISQSNEGIEALTIDINGGVLNVTASDDGINASGGSGSTTQNGFMGFGSDNGSGVTTAEKESEGSEYVSLAVSSSTPDTSQASDGSLMKGHGGMGGGMMDVEEDAYLRITGGEVNVNAGGDGLDSNGTIYIDGGTVLVNGPTNSGNGALDYGVDAIITGGTVLIAGSSGMAESFGTSSTQYSMMITLDSVASAGTAVTLTDSTGNTILTFTPEKQFQNVILSSPELKEGTYTLTVGSESQEVTVSSITTTVGSSGFGGGMMGGMPHGGGMGQSPDQNFGGNGMTPPGGGMGPGSNGGGMHRSDDSTTAAY